MDNGCEVVDGGGVLVEDELLELDELEDEPAKGYEHNIMQKRKMSLTTRTL